MVSVEKALELILHAVQPLGKEAVQLTAAQGRILAEEVVAPRDHPPWHNAAMDGYAVRHEDTIGATINDPTSLQVVETVSAGMLSNRKLARGKAVRISTGAPLPEGADAVVRIEETVESNQGRIIQLKKEVRKNQDVRHQGEDLHKGEAILSEGEEIRPPEVGLLALAQKKQLAVFKKPRVAILATGDELVEPWERPTPSQIINTNSYALAAQVAQSGGEALLLGIAKDKSKPIGKAALSLMDKIRQGLLSDVLLIVGGVGPGCGDHTLETLLKMGAEIHFKGVGIRPGHPFAFGCLKGKPVFALPGNPVAAMVSFFVFARPTLLKMGGCRNPTPPIYSARLLVDIDQHPGKRHYIRAVISSDKQGLKARPTPSQGSGVLTSMSQANGLIILPETSTGVRAGESVSVQFFGDLRNDISCTKVRL